MHIGLLKYLILFAKSHTFRALANVDPLYLANKNKHDMLNYFRL